MIAEEKARLLVDQHDRIANLWDIGPVHKSQLLCLLDDLICQINNEYNSDHFQQFLVDNGYYTLYKTHMPLE